MSFYARMANTAHSLLTRYGAAATLIKTAPGAYDVNTGTVSVSETAHDCTLAAFDVGQEDIDGNLVKQGDKQAYISTKTNVPKPETDDKITWQGDQYTIVAPVKDLAPAGTSVLYEAIIRK